MNENRYGEPLLFENTRNGLYLIGRVPGGRPNGEGLAMVSALGCGLSNLGMGLVAFVDRMLSCVNACRTIDDPTKFEKLVAALEEFEAAWKEFEDNQPSGHTVESIIQCNQRILEAVKTVRQSFGELKLP